MIFRPFLIPALISGSIASGNISINIYDYLVCQERHYFLTLSFAEAYTITFCLIHIVLILGTVVITLLLLQPDVKGEYHDVDNNTTFRKPRYLKILTFFWAALLIAIFGFQTFISALLFIGNFKSFVPSMFVEVLTSVLLALL